MSTFPTEIQVINSVLEGIKDAHKNYMHWTNNAAWLSIAPEYMINIFIGQHLSKLDPRPEVWFEIGIDALAESLKIKSVDDFIANIKRHKNDSSNKNQTEKIDIVLDDAKEKHSCVIIEVKNAVSKYGKGSEGDIIRLCKALSYKSPLQYGIFAFFANGNNDINTIVDEIEVKANLTIKDNNPGVVLNRFSMPIAKDNDGWECSAVCFVLKRKVTN